MLPESEKVQIVNVSNRNLVDHHMKGDMSLSHETSDMSLSHESPYSSRIGAAADIPLVSRTSFHAVSCYFSTVDISTAQALLFESAG